MGRALGKLFAQKGANVVIVARDVEKLEAALAYISVSPYSTTAPLSEVKQSAALRPGSQRLHYISADVTVPSENTRIVSEATAWNNGQPPDIVWANAGMAVPGLFLDTSIETLRSQMDVNYWAATYLAHAMLKSWLQPPVSSFSTSNARGSESLAQSSFPRHFVITSSTLAFCGIAGYTPYSPAKAALRSLSDSLRSELNLYAGAARRSSPSSPSSAFSPSIPDVKIHTVCPGTILTPGHTREETMKHPVTRILEEGDPAQTEDEVALAAFKGLERGDYLITTQFLGAAMRASALQGSPRNGWGVLDTLFGWVTGVAWLFIGPDMERKVWRWGRENGVMGKS